MITAAQDMWRGNPVLTTVLFGLPFGFLCLICYSICCADIMDADDEDEEEEGEKINPHVIVKHIIWLLASDNMHFDSFFFQNFSMKRKNKWIFHICDL